MAGTRLAVPVARLPHATRTNRLVVRSAATLGGKKVNKVVLAYSGGLDTSVILTWLKETYDCEVVTFTADLGQVTLSDCCLFYGCQAVCRVLHCNEHAACIRPWFYMARGSQACNATSSAYHS